MIRILLLVIALLSSAYAHEMQHGFIISDDDKYFSHLVAQGHHSHQLSASGVLIIPSEHEQEVYRQHKEVNGTVKKTYFLFQAQKLNLPLVKAGQILTGHIIESAIGDYDPKNVIVRNAKIRMDAVYINLINPFFLNP